ncbi:hypothetical protein CAPTEDRAFT_217101 [Capitella teleta]|uniref:Uncharacterized protein n=1 Tax=Capitella teleta TaxID=283909 RepID=R7TFD7_CAPTE|nr:hypothetical protein CAPTEDRAFT_217101 [Capitella teleta]|eukprot:ELT92459.1 hypothetical protein CAPTEDRAFT_217101 [Capitella teleta]
MQAAEEIVIDEENLAGSIKSELSVASMALIAWAVIITLAIASLLAVIFRRVRKSRKHSAGSVWPSGSSVISDAESGPSTDSMSDRASVVDLDPEAEVTECKHHEVDVENTNGLFDDDNPSPSNRTDSVQPKFANALTRTDGQGSLKGRGFFLPPTTKY